MSQLVLSRPATEPTAMQAPPHRARRVVLAVLALAALYVATIAAGDARTASGSDAGGKIATVRTMAEHGSWSPEVGYWAARHDPRGRFHPLYNTARAGNRWVQVISLPFAFIGAALWRVGGAPAILLLPLLGSLLAAVASRRLAVLLGARTGWPAFWLVGVVSPVAFYAGDFWEHSAAVGLALLALTVLWDGGTRGRALLAGLLAGVAMVLRTEVVLYAGVFALACMADRDQRRVWRRDPLRPAVAAVGAVAVLAANRIVEGMLGLALRTTRTAGAATAAGSNLLDRAHDGALTSVGLFRDGTWTAVAAGGVAVTGVLLLALAASRPTWRSRSRVGLVLSAPLFIARIAQGPGFVPGFLAATPAAALGLAAPARGRRRIVVRTALLTLPLVWMFQWTGQHVAQWGGRYVLLSAALLSVVAGVTVEERGLREVATRAVLAMAVVTTALGLVWHAQRTAGYASSALAIGREPRDEVIVSDVAHLGRDLGAWYGDHRWLTALRARELPAAVAVARAAGADRLGVVVLEGDERRLPPFAGYRRASTADVPLVSGVRFTLVRYVATR